MHLNAHTTAGPDARIGMNCWLLAMGVKAYCNYCSYWDLIFRFWLQWLKQDLNG
jgi:hypothetical protein